MGLFRLLTFILVIFVAWRMIRNYQAKISRSESNSAKDKILVREKMVKCEMCDVHLPADEAITVKNGDTKYCFCTPEHKDSFNQQNS